MRKILMTSAVALATGFAASPGWAACPDDIDSFSASYRQTVEAEDGAGVLSDQERTELESLSTAARQLSDAGQAEACNTVITQASRMLENAVAPQAIEPETLEDHRLTNAAGEDLGSVEDVLIDPTSGRIAYLLVEHGGFLGMGEDVFALPWSVVRYQPGGETILVDISEETLKNAPRFSREDRTPLGQRKWALDNHAYYGVPPYWQGSLGAAVLASNLSAQDGASTSGEIEPAGATPDNGGDESGERVAELESQIAELKQNLESQSQSLEELRGENQKLSEAQGGDDKLNELTAQVAAMEKQIQTLSTPASLTENAQAKDSADAGAKADAQQSQDAQSQSGQAQDQQAQDEQAQSGQTQGEQAQNDQAQGGQTQGGTQDGAAASTDLKAEAREERKLPEGSEAASSDSDPTATQQAAKPKDQSGMANAAQGPCSDAFVELDARIEEIEKSDPSTAAAMTSARSELKYARTMAERDGDSTDCQARLEQVRETLARAEGGEKQQSN